MTPEEMRSAMLAQQGQGGMMPGGDPSMDPMMDDMTMTEEELGLNDPSQAQDMEQQAPEEPPISRMPIEEVIQNINLAKSLKKKDDKSGSSILDKMASEVLRGIELDKQSREGWMEAMQEGLKLALLVRETKTWPWMNSSNIKYPLIATAAMQFSARSYPALVPSDGACVKARAIPSAINTMFLDAASRVARHMSWQLMVKAKNWETEMDKMLMTLSVTGTMFKKTYYDSITKENCSYIIYPEDFIVDYQATSLDDAYRKTEIKRFNHNEIVEKINNDEEYLDIEYGEPTITDEDMSDLLTGDDQSEINKATKHTFYECHTFWDLDDDGYEEPVVITIHRDTEKVVRVTARFTSEDIEASPKGDIIRIKPLEMYTNFTFIENPAGSLYGIGFGLLLATTNEAINSAINQLVDAGTLNNLQSGFIAKTLRMNMAQTPITPGEWRVVQATGEEMKNGLVPLPTKEPSSVLLQLTQMLIQSGMQLASVAEIFVGKMPGQNTPATTTQQTVEQSMAVFTAVYKRVYRALNEEFKKLMRLNRINPTLVQKDAEESGLDISPQDYAMPEYSIIPGADPAGDSQTTKQAKFGFVSQYLLPLGTINPMALTLWALEFMEVPNYQQLVMQPQPPQPDPNVVKAQSDAQAKQMDLRLKQEAQSMELQHKEKLAALEYANKERQGMQKMEQARQEMYMKAQQQKLDAVERVNKVRSMVQDRQMKSQMNQQEASAKFAENRMSHFVKMQQQRENHSLKKQQSASKDKGNKKG